MKNILKKAWSLCIVTTILIMSSSKLYGNDCEGGVDRIVSAFEYMTKQVESVSTFDELSSINFEASVARSGVGDIPATCEDYILTQKDKQKLLDSYIIFINKMFGKIYDFTNNAIDESMLSSQKEIVINAFEKVLANSVTLMDLANNMGAMKF